METKKRILLVDDEEINLEFFEVMLTKLGFETQKANNGIDALELVKNFKPDLIILDNVMPRLSGWEVTNIIKTHEDYREYAETPIIMFSAMDDVKDKVEGLEMGADDYITKPFNFSEVLARIHAVLRTRELIGQIEEREARIRVVEDISERVLDFASGLRAPLLNMVGPGTRPRAGVRLGKELRRANARGSPGCRRRARCARLGRRLAQGRGRYPQELGDRPARHQDEVSRAH